MLGEFMSDGMKIRIDEISNQMICVEDKEIMLLVMMKKKFENFTWHIEDSDFDIMKEHVSLSYELLSKLPYPKHLKNVLFTLDVIMKKLLDSYLNGYSGNRLPLQARIIAIADIFGLTAPDRPYKKGYKLSKAMSILKSMVKIMR